VGDEYDEDDEEEETSSRHPYRYSTMTSTTSTTSYIGQMILHRLLSLRYLSDCTPLIFYTILTNGKYAAVAVVSLYLVIILFWLPFWLLSFVISEWGVYLCMIGTIFLIGRMIIRLIAFPGASQKIITDIEQEFNKYSIRMIHTACINIIELATVFEPRDKSGEQTLESRTVAIVPNIWRRVKSFRCRVLAVYIDVLQHMYQQQQDDDNAITSLELSSNSIPIDAALPNGNYGPNLTRYGNNLLSGDIGNVLALPLKVRNDGRELLQRLENVTQLINHLESVAGPLLEQKSKIVTEQSRVVAGKMKDAASELRDFVASFKGSDDSTDTLDDPTDVMRRKIEEQGKGNMMETMKIALTNVATMLDPPPHNSIFGLDVIRGCMLSRYQGSKQLWVQRPTGGRIDVVHFPAKKSNNGEGIVNPNAVLYCNPNAGLIEVVTGMSLTGGNVPTVDSNGNNVSNDSWVDYYTEQGIDVYVFNYAGYGRSYGTTACLRGPIYQGEPSTGCLRKLYRIIRSALFSFQPTPDTVRVDGIAVAKHILLECGVTNLYIHGESIGGIAAAGTARYLSQSALRDHIVLLICDRTFCNLEAIAQRLVGDWTGYAIRFLTPLWNTDVTGDFLAASCPKIVASDAADVIIAEPSSLKSGIAIWKELHREVATTKGIGWIPSTPLQYRMAEWENCCVNDSKHVSPATLFRAQPPVWPRDKHVSFEEAFHFAACCKRIGKLATSVARAASRENEGLDSLDVSSQPIVVQAWAILGSCDGLTGATLGVATKRGYDASITWLCAVLVFGGQIVARQAEKRTQHQQGTMATLEIAPSDFDIRPNDCRLHDEDVCSVYPRPIPIVLQTVISLLEIADESMVKCKFIMFTLYYLPVLLLTNLLCTVLSYY
jgi:hypothetical protein